MIKANNLIDTNKEEIIDLDLSSIRKKRIRIDGDDNRILEINTSDLGVITRLKDAEQPLQELSEQAQKIAEIGNLEEDENFSKFAEELKSIDEKMRNIIDDIFRANVSEVCGVDGSMFDPISGSTRWEIIVKAISSLYEDNIAKEIEAQKTNKANKTVHKHTDKYVGK